MSLDKLVSEPTDTDLDRVLADTVERVAEKRAKISVLTGGSATVDPNARMKIIEEHNFYRNVWKNRRDKCMDLIGNILESSSKKSKDFMESAGLESDESEKVTLPPLIPLPKLTGR